VSPVLPGLQRQTADDMLPLGEFESEGHNRQVLTPKADEYVSTPHAKQLSTESAPEIFEYFPAAQTIHVSTECAPEWFEYVPGAHI